MQAYVSHFNLSVEGYWPNKKKDFIDPESGVYLVFTGVRQPKGDGTYWADLHRLIYIGKSKDIQQRLSGDKHEHQNDFENECDADKNEIPYFAYVDTGAKDMAHVEDALIFHYKPSINAKSTISFGHRPTRITLAGETCSCLGVLDFVVSKPENA